MTSVAGQQPKGRDRARKRRDAAAIGVSIIAHLAILAIVGLSIPRPVYREMTPLQPVNVWLMPRLTPEQHRPVEHRAAAPKTPPPTSPEKAKPAPLPSPIQAAAAPAPPSGARAGPPASTVGVDDGQGVREALRTSVGCDADPVVHLTPPERDRCNRNIGREARRAPSFSGIDIAKRSRFDAQVDADDRRRANREGVMQDLVTPCAQEGSNLGGGCLPDSAVMHIRQH